MQLYKVFTPLVQRPYCADHGSRTTLSTLSLGGMSMHVTSMNLQGMLIEIGYVVTNLVLVLLTYMRVKLELSLNWLPDTVSNMRTR